jgi:hypothetical protein
MVTVLPAIAVLAALAAVLAFQHHRESVDDRRTEMRALGVTSAVAARRFLEDQFAILATVAANPDVRDAKLKRMRPFLRDAARSGRFSSGLGFIDAKGFSRLSTTRPPGSPPINLTDREYVQEALAGRPAVSDVLLGKLRNRPIVAFAYPVTNTAGKRNGLVAGSLQLDRFNTALQRLLFSPGAGETILDGTNHVIVSAKPVRGIQKPPPAYPLDELRGARDGVVDRIPMKGGDRIAGFSRIAGTPWVVLVDRPRGDVIGPLDKALWAELAAILLLALVGVLLTFATGRRLDRLDEIRARALDEQRTIALQLQTSMLPALRVPDGLRAYAGYVPAQGAMSVGGDWYDLVDAGDDCVALSVGDVAGHGLRAAATMGKLRAATRAEALHSRSPVEALTALDRFASHLDERPLATVAYAVLNVRTGVLRYALAGHPPPLLIRAGGTTELLEDGRSPLLGVKPTEARAEARTTMAPGDTLVVYTDGLIERPESSIDDGLAKLAASAPRLAGDPEALGEALLASVSEPRRDDAAVLVVQFVGVRQPSSVAS